MPKGGHSGVSQRLAKLSRRERQCLDVLFQRGEGTVTDVLGSVADPPSYSAVRATLNVLVAARKPLIDAKKVFISTTAGASTLAITRATGRWARAAGRCRSTPAI